MKCWWRHLLGFGCGLLIGPLVHAQGFSWPAMMANNEGVSELKKEMKLKAYQKFIEALAYDPFNPVVQMNLGLIFMINEEYEKASQAFAEAESLARTQGLEQLQFEALFNMAEAEAKQSRIDAALEYYQKALAIRPDSIEVKTNIELLWRSQQGKGGGSNQNQNQNQNQQQPNQDQGQGDQNKNQPQPKDPGQEQQKKQPKPFQSQQLTPEDVRKILEEIKNQEQAIRANDYQKGAKESPRGKDW